jgi:predicted DCC family thiol-disulfide oxidoreductase YuxK
MGRLQHLVLYDGTCGLCDYSVQFLLKYDKKEIFAFAPLQGTTAEQFLSTLPKNLVDVDSLILIEDFKSTSPRIYIQSKAIFRIFWLLGSFWKLLGGLAFLPSFLFDWGYQLMARHRYQLFAQRCLIPQKNQLDRFLP